ncbi:unnamed protein product [Rangifer tarandus platyrhynchus]|uniref:Uncharacterized protein n=1 Tax=Rangifer tarandus platyrhynchus TaxID=3082113 RepID=A0AC59YHH9_RANTA
MRGSGGQALPSEQRCPPPSPAGPPPVLMGPFSAWPGEMVPGPSCLPRASLPSSGISRRREEGREHVSEMVRVHPPRAAGAASPRVTGSVLPPSAREGRF